MVSDTVIVNGAALDNAANLQEDEFSTTDSCTPPGFWDIRLFRI
jgi:hypothetical protein